MTWVPVRDRTPTEKRVYPVRAVPLHQEADSPSKDGWWAYWDGEAFRGINRDSHFMTHALLRYGFPELARVVEWQE